MRILSKYDLFIFDWDDTLAGPAPFASPIKRLFKDMIFKDANSHLERYQPRKGDGGIVPQQGTYGLYSVAYDLYSTLFKPKLKDGARELLNLLRSRRKRIAILSDGRPYRLIREARFLGVDKYVEEMLSTASLNQIKPNPTGLIAIMRRLKVRKERCIYIGDMRTDVLTAKIAGIDSCAVASGIDSYIALKGTDPSYTFKNIRSLINKLQT